MQFCVCPDRILVWRYSGISRALRIMFCRPDMQVRKFCTVASILFALFSTATFCNSAAMASCGDYLHTRSSQPVRHVRSDGLSEEGLTGSATVTESVATHIPYSVPFRGCDSPECHQAPLPTSVPSVPLERLELEDRLLLTGNRDSSGGLLQWRPRYAERAACALSGYPFRLLFPPEAAC